MSKGYIASVVGENAPFIRGWYTHCVGDLSKCVNVNPNAPTRPQSNAIRDSEEYMTWEIRSFSESTLPLATFKTDEDREKYRQKLIDTWLELLNDFEPFAVTKSNFALTYYFKRER